MNGYEEKIKDCLFLEVCNAAGREEWDGLAHQQKENLMLVCRLRRTGKGSGIPV